MMCLMKKLGNYLLKLRVHDDNTRNCVQKGKPAKLIVHSFQVHENVSLQHKVGFLNLKID